MWPFSRKTYLELDTKMYRVSFEASHRSKYVRKSITLEATGFDDARKLATEPYDYVFDVEVAFR